MGVHFPSWINSNNLFQSDSASDSSISTSQYQERVVYHISDLAQHQLLQRNHPLGISDLVAVHQLYRLNWQTTY
jgi:hypothetical protein